MIEVRGSEKKIGGFIQNGNIRASDIATVPAESFLFRFLRCVSSVTGVLEQGIDVRDMEWEVSVLEQAARLLQLATFQMGVNVWVVFGKNYKNEREFIALLYDEERIEELGAGMLRGLFRDMSLDVCDICSGMLGQKELIERLESCWRGFIAFASAYVAVEQMEGWFYG